MSSVHAIRDVKNLKLIIPDINLFLACEFFAKYGANCGIDLENPKLNHSKSMYTRLYELAHAENSRVESL
jgi:hypothetical protein